MSEEKALITQEQKLTQEEISLIRETIAEDATDQELKLFLYTAQARGLNPLTRQIHFVVRGKGENRSGSIQTGIDGFRLIAQRSGKYAPSPKPTLFEYKNGKLFSATVWGMKHIGGQFVEFSATAIHDEYLVDYSPIWKKMPHTMIEKCAEAKMLRRGFPEELSGIYTDEEMSQADIIPVLQGEIPAPSEYKPLSEDYGICEIHNVPWQKFKKGNASWYSHKNDDGSYCNQSKPVEKLPTPTKEIQTQPAKTSPVMDDTIYQKTVEDWLRKLGLTRRQGLEKYMPLFEGKTKFSEFNAGERQILFNAFKADAEKDKTTIDN